MAEVKSAKKKWGIFLVIAPIVLWLIVALANGFSFSHPWLSGTLDLILGVLAFVVIVVGFILIGTSSDEQE